MSGLIDKTKLGVLKVVSPEKEEWYKTTCIKKRSGGTRVIEEPVVWLKDKQHKIYKDILLKKGKVSRYAHGCILHRSITTAAREHVGKKYVLKMDISDCFHSITTEMLEATMVKQGFDAADASLIAYLCTNSRGVLPQGAPTSPALANMVLMYPYAELRLIAERKGYVFNGYLDDLIFSSDNPQLFHDTELLKFHLKKYGFHVNPKKVSFMRRKKEVLSLCVSPGKEHPRLPKKRRNWLRGFVHRLLMKKRAGETLNPKAVNRAAGWVAFAEMAGDQKAVLLKQKIQEIRR